MESKIQKWGNSLALRIPKAFAQNLNFDQDTPVSLNIEKGRLVITTLVEDEYDLEYLLNQITEDNIHQEIETGGAVGKEVW